MSEENTTEEFKAIRITLSQEAFDRMEKIMKDAKFRSYSSTIEECIRITSDIMDDIYLLAGERDAPMCNVEDKDLAETMRHTIIRMSRITGRIARLVSK